MPALAEKAGSGWWKRQAEPERPLGRPPHGDPPRAGRRSLTAAGPGRWTPSSRLPCVPGPASPLVRSDHTLEGFPISRRPQVARAGAQPGESLPGVSPTSRPGVGHWGLPCRLTSLWAGLRTGGQALSRQHRRRGAAVDPHTALC